MDELRFSAITTAGGATLTVHAGDTGLERAIIGTGTGITASTTGTTALNINASEAPNSLEITGNSGANSLVGTAFADTINGLGGNDTLTGGAGADVFRFTTTPNATSNRDLITDFTTGSDVLSFKRASYAGFSSSATLLSSAQFLSGDGVTAATTIAQRFLYDTTSGILCYDRDGIGTTYSAIQVAVFGVSSHPALAYTDLALTA